YMQDRSRGKGLTTTVQPNVRLLHLITLSTPKSFYVYLKFTSKTFPPLTCCQFRRAYRCFLFSLAYNPDSEHGGCHEKVSSPRPVLRRSACHCSAKQQTGLHGRSRTSGSRRHLQEFACRARALAPRREDS